MTTTQRFSFNDNGYIIDRLNPAATPVYCHEGHQKDDMHLREQVLWISSPSIAWKDPHLAKATPPLWASPGARPVVAPGLDRNRPLTLGGPRLDRISSALG
jgi:hypothetical protein